MKSPPTVLSRSTSTEPLSNSCSWTDALGDHSVSVQLGGGISPGLVITNGQLSSLQASVSTDFDLFGVHIVAKSLSVAYVATNQEFDIFGGLSVETKFITFDSTLGSEQNPGLKIVKGQLASMNLSVTGGFSLFGITVSANGLTITYDASMHQLELSGGVMLDFNSEIQAAASLSQGGLLIDTTTGALSIDATNGLEVTADVEVAGILAIKDLDISYQNTAAGVDFSARGTVSLPGGYSVSLTQLDITDSQLTDIGVQLQGSIPLGDTGFYLNSLSGAVHHLNDLKNLEVDASATISFGKTISVPNIPDVISAGDYSLIQATGSIVVDAHHLDLTGSVILVGGLLGEGSASMDLNWQQGLYQVTLDHYSMYAGTFTFSGNLGITNQGDMTLKATADVRTPNVPLLPSIIRNKELGQVNFYVQVRPEDPNPTDLYFAAWTSLLGNANLTYGFSIDFHGDITLLNGKAIQNLGATNSNTSTNAPSTYSQSYTAPNSQATVFEFTASSTAFENALNYLNLPTEVIPDERDEGTEAGAITYVSTTYYLSHPATVGDLSFYVYDSQNNAMGSGQFTMDGDFQYTPVNNSPIVATSAVLENGVLRLDWNQDPGTTYIEATYSYSSAAYFQVTQPTANGNVIQQFTIDPTSSNGTGTGAQIGSTIDDRVFYVTPNPANTTGQFQVELVTPKPLPAGTRPRSPSHRFIPPPTVSVTSDTAVQSDGSLFVAMLARTETPPGECPSRFRSTTAIPRTRPTEC